ncbi:hypothetical protein PUN28_005619 [Cardiocondyla obscurior]|uniref:Uncharacterized protein n=1 Tax=Cardiocondyla obscurior TaxID=286306 RepID=A0AAW2GIP7_9HYME
MLLLRDNFPVFKDKFSSDPEDLLLQLHNVTTRRRIYTRSIARFLLGIFHSQLYTFILSVDTNFDSYRVVSWDVNFQWNNSMLIFFFTYTSISDTGYVHFNVSRSFPEKSSEDLGVTETHTTRSFSNNNLLLFDFNDGFAKTRNEYVSQLLILVPRSNTLCQSNSEQRMALQNFGQSVKQRRNFRLTQYRRGRFLQRFLVVLKIKAVIRVRKCFVRALCNVFLN